MCCNANHSSFLTSASFVVVNFGGAVDLMPSPELLLGKLFPLPAAMIYQSIEGLLRPNRPDIPK
ncbi:hypothetical protein H5410_054071 [Solanum commersonii]|uniref:Uncharacterized protein n=1 Tax=Solanum commersonii TaxID=4109 RepID=A0A9J5X880_SOLCO|nr:hypothetical protein H5410_054071 [Solanum commersonii]